MIGRNTFLLPALAGFLILLLAAEWLLPQRNGAEWQPPPAIPSATADASANAEITQWTDTILARPLLSATRRPAPQTGVAVDDTLPRLSAIIVIGGSRRAIFAASGQKPQLVAEGGEIGLYHIKTVAPDKVDLLGPDGLVTLRPQFISASPTSPPAPQ